MEYSMSYFSRVFALSAVLAMLGAGLSGCIVSDRGPYRYDHGDRIDRFGHREEHWCDNNRDDEHCR
jgi:hypothetical protein